MRKAAGRIAAGLLTAVLMLTGNGLSLQAARTGQIQVSYTCDSGKTAIKGAEFSAVCVATGTIQKDRIVYTLQKDYEDSGLNPQKPEFWNNSKTAEKLMNCYEKASHKGTMVQTTDASGNAYFDGCGIGVYLVWQSGSEGDSKEYDTALPLVITVPSNRNADSTDWNWLSKVYPKTSKKPAADKATEKEQKFEDTDSIKTTESKKEEVKVTEKDLETDENGKRGKGTGDESNLYLFLFLSLASAAGLATFRRHQKRQAERH